MGGESKNEAPQIREANANAETPQTSNGRYAEEAIKGKKAMGRQMRRTRMKQMRLVTVQMAVVKKMAEVTGKRRTVQNMITKFQVATVVGTNATRYHAGYAVCAFALIVNEMAG